MTRGDADEIATALLKSGLCRRGGDVIGDRSDDEEVVSSISDQDIDEANLMLKIGTDQSYCKENGEDDISESCEKEIVKEDITPGYVYEYKRKQYSYSDSESETNSDIISISDLESINDVITDWLRL